MCILEAHMWRPLTDSPFFVAIALSALATPPVHGQTIRPADQNGVAFEVASVKPNTSAAGASTIGAADFGLSTSQSLDLSRRRTQLPHRLGLGSLVVRAGSRSTDSTGRLSPIEIPRKISDR